jgi:hypothetical protein
VPVERRHVADLEPRNAQSPRLGLGAAGANGLLNEIESSDLLAG